MAFKFQKATKKLARLRLSIAGPSGSGKTYTALKVATEMNLGKIAVIDTERGSASKYANKFDFDVLELTEFHPEKYIEAIKDAEKAGYDVLIIDSTTHEWAGKGGCLDLHDAEVKRQRTTNTYTAWSAVTPLHQRFIDAIVGSSCHVISSVRSKTDYVQEKDGNNRTTVRKVGMAAVKRDGMEYEYDIHIEMDIDHNGVIGKTRCEELDSKVFPKPGAELASIIVAWLTDSAEPAPEPTPEAAPAPEVKQPAPQGDSEHDKLIKETRAIFDGQGKTEADWQDYSKKYIAGKTTTYLATSLSKLKIAASKRLIEEIEGPIFKALEAVGVGSGDALDKVERIAETPDGLD